MTRVETTPVLRTAKQATSAATHRQLQIRHLAVQALIWVFVGSGLVIMVIPALWMVLSSFKSLAEIFAVPMRLLPERWMWENYVEAIETTHMWRAYGNSTILAVTQTLIMILTSTWGGYVFAKLEWPGRERVLMLLLSTMMIPGFLTLIPRFVLVIKMGMMNSFAGILVPGMVGTFSIFMCRQFMLGIPKDLTDAAIVDGCNVLGVYWRVVLPLCRPVISVLAIFTFQGSWNSLLWPLMVLTDSKLHTIPVTLAGLRTQEMFLYHIQMAGASLAVIPVIVVFLIFQKHIIGGVALTGLKG